jgi:hypothetical protein
MQNSESAERRTAKACHHAGGTLSSMQGNSPKAPFSGRKAPATQRRLPELLPCGASAMLLCCGHIASGTELWFEKSGFF